MLQIDTDKMWPDQLLQMYEMLDGNKIEHALLKGQIVDTMSKKFADNEIAKKWMGSKFGHRKGKSTKSNLTNLYRCYRNRDYPKNFGLSALYELTAPKNDVKRDQILALLKDKERVKKPDVIAAAATIESGGVVESADNLPESQTSPTATSSPMLSIRCGREKPRKYDVRSKDEFKSLLRFIADLAAPHQTPAFLAACLPDAVSREELFRMDAVRDDVSTVASSGNAVPDSPPGIEVVALPSSRIVLRSVASRKDMIRPRPTESH
jgi:hypothetical protein